MRKHVLYHGTRDDFDRLDPTKTVDGGLHFGSLAQAKMRCGPSGRIIKAEVRVEKARSSKDTGQGWRSKIQSAKKSGFDAITYLNRYEGIDIESLESALADGKDPDGMTDAQFRKDFPEADESVIVFHADQIRILKTFDLSSKAPNPEPS